MLKGIVDHVEWASDGDQLVLAVFGVDRKLTILNTLDIYGYDVAQESDRELLDEYMATSQLAKQAVEKVDALRSSIAALRSHRIVPIK